MPSTARNTAPPPRDASASLGAVDFDAIYEEMVDYVWNVVCRMGVRPSDAEDVVQEVFVTVYRRLGEFEGRSKVTTWLYGICYRVAHDRRRLAHVRRRAPGDDGQLDDMGGEAIAEALEIPLGTVYSRLRLAREQFKKTVARVQARDRFRTADGNGPRPALRSDEPGSAAIPGGGDR